MFSKCLPRIKAIYADNINLRSLRNLRESINAQNNMPCFKIFPTDQHDLRRQYQSALFAKSAGNPVNAQNNMPCFKIFPTDQHDLRRQYQSALFAKSAGNPVNAQNNMPCFKIFPTDQHDLRRQYQSALSAKSAGNPFTHKIICHVSKYFPQINMIYADNINLRSLRNLREIHSRTK
ncbi:hypothetical protein [Pedobacter paludis]|nr:hypothetical protein [Pedobacter paludis]